MEYTLQWLFTIRHTRIRVFMFFLCSLRGFLCGAVLISFSLSQAHCGSETCFCSVNGNAERFALQGKIMEVRKPPFPTGKSCKDMQESSRKWGFHFPCNLHREGIFLEEHLQSVSLEGKRSLRRNKKGLLIAAFRAVWLRQLRKLCQPTITLAHRC